MDPTLLCRSQVGGGNVIGDIDLFGDGNAPESINFLKIDGF